ncbi:hypothetical protein Ct9H90mP29_00540 [bacterium]|nr:MAG: hypothetical protein Ct9H90mP29_00540 [bacterium]
MMNNEHFRWGIIGTGGIANAFKRDLEYLMGHKISAVLSRSMHTAENFSSNISDCRSFDDPHLLWNFQEWMLCTSRLQTPFTLNKL